MLGPAHHGRGGTSTGYIAVTARVHGVPSFLGHSYLYFIPIIPQSQSWKKQSAGEIEKPGFFCTFYGDIPSIRTEKGGAIVNFDRKIVHNLAILTLS